MIVERLSLNAVSITVMSLATCLLSCGGPSGGMSQADSGGSTAGASSGGSTGEAGNGGVPVQPAPQA